MSFIESVSKSGSWETTITALYVTGRIMCQSILRGMIMYGWYDLLRSLSEDFDDYESRGCLVG